MILAAADYAENDRKKPAERKDAPRELKLAWQWETYGLTFPVAEMEAGLLKKMSACLNVYKAIHMQNLYIYGKGKTTSEFRKDNMEYAAICKEIKELREHSNGK